MVYIIVKNAGDTWSHYFVEDPKMDAVHPTYSCHETFTGKELGIKPSYDDFKEAEHDCANLNMANPSGDYFVCVAKR